MLTSFILIIVFAIVLALSAGIVLSAVKRLATISGLGKYALASMVLALSTSLPELVIAVQAGLQGRPNLSLGSVLGSNIADLSIIIGLATIIGGNLAVSKNIIKTDIYYAFLIAAAPLILLMDHQLTRFDGLILILLFFFWQTLSIKSGKKAGAGIISSVKKQVGSQMNHVLIALLKLSAGLIGLVLSAHMLVGQAGNLATHFQISPLIIGIFLVGLGSSLPELALEVKAIKNKEAELALGDLLGSIVANSSLILGVTAVLSTITIAQPKLYMVTTLFFLIIFATFYIFIRTKAKLERWEGAILLMLYFILVTIELL
ncbi:MAG: sodium:calcium antiporter [Patescibacteria group bacterium]